MRGSGRWFVVDGGGDAVSAEVACVRETGSARGLDGGEESDGDEEDREDVDRAGELERDVVDGLLYIVGEGMELERVLGAALEVLDRWRDEMSAVGTRWTVGPTMASAEEDCNPSRRRSAIRICSYSASIPLCIDSTSDCAGEEGVVEDAIDDGVLELREAKAGSG